mmetsp:Transcript_14254/g.39583  ORF Transcript_14254/g.39583 Transcript_14254/m.39583 type:complete len:201 (-) Transcript_14254:1340-1942(-)
MVVRLFRQATSPVPRGGEASVNARASVISTSIKTMLEVVGQYRQFQFVGRTEMLRDVGTHAFIRAKLRQVLKELDKRIQEARNLSVLVDKDQCVGNVAIAEMDHRKPNPRGSRFLLGLRKQAAHDLANTGAVLNSVQTLAGIVQVVARGRRQEIVIGAAPETVHVSHHLTPESKTLPHKGILRAMRMRQFGAFTGTNVVG